MTVPVSPPGVRPPFLQRLSPVAFALAALLLIFFLYQLVGGVITLVLAHGRFTPENVDLVRWATGIGEIAFILLPTLWLTRKRYGTLREPLRVHIPEVKELAVTMVAVFALQQILQTYMVLQDSIPVPGGVQKIVNEMKDMMDETYRLLATAHTPAEFLSVVLIVALVPAVSEEMLFRGLVQRSFEDAWGGIRGAVAAGVIFGAYHLNPFAIVPLVALGVYFGFIVYRSGNITVAVSAHFFNNFVACAAAYLALDEDFLVVAPSARPTPTLVALNFMCASVVFLAATLYFVHITGHEGHEEDLF